MISWIASDLSPGDADSVRMAPEGLQVHLITSTADPLFERGYMALWDEFGPSGEMEQREILSERFTWQGTGPLKDYALWYEMIVICQGHLLAGVIDHTAIVRKSDPAAAAIVHLSHIWLSPAYRRSGLAGWMRAFPIQSARRCLNAAGRSPDSAIVLVGEMEHPTPDMPLRLIRLKAFEKAGYLKINPASVPYHQPDFRSPAVIDSAGGPKPLPFGLVIRRVSQENESSLTGLEIRQIVADLYHMYSTGMRAADMIPLWTDLRRNYPQDDQTVPLVRPTHG